VWATDWRAVHAAVAFDEPNPDDPDTLTALIDGMLTGEPSLASRRPTGEAVQPLQGRGLRSILPHYYDNERDRKQPWLTSTN
jgi:hypothetical protein